MMSSLSTDAIRMFLMPQAEHVAIQVIEQTGSTNADLLAKISQLAQPTLLVAQKQVAGRGRAGRAWLSAAGTSLTFSLAWRFQRPIQQLSGLPLAIGVVLAEVLAGWDTPVQLKWPNDVLKDGAKLAGVLIETAIDKHDSQSHVWAVIGIGMNLAVPDTLAQQIGRPVAALPRQLAQDPNQLLAALTNGLAIGLQQFDEQGFAAFSARWNALHAFANQPVAITDRDVVVQEGIAVGVDMSGQLLLQTDTGAVAVVAGDVSLRAKKED